MGTTRGSAWRGCPFESVAVFSRRIAIVRLSKVVEVAMIDESHVELRCTKSWDPLDIDSVSCPHVNLQISIVLVT